jgi:zinc protease
MNAGIPACLAAALVMWAGPLAAQTKNAPRRTVWDSGMTVITETDDASPVTVLELVIRGGRRAEPAGKEGLSYLTTRLTLEIPDEGKVQELMEKSSRYMMTSRGDESLIHIECLTEFLDGSLSVIAKILGDPLFSGIRIGHVRDFMDNQRKIEADDNVSLGHLALFDAILGPLGYGGSVYGTRSALAAVRARDIQAFYDERYAAPNMILVSISNLGPAELEDVLRRHFGRFKAGKPAPPPSQAPAGPGAPGTAGSARETIIGKDTTQVFVSLGFALPPVSRKSYAAGILLANLLGNGPGSRLWPLRTERKLAYNVNARAHAFAGGGLFAAYLETDGAKRDEARRALADAMRAVWESGVSSDELAAAKAFARTDLLRANETKSRRAATLGELEALGLGAEHFLRLFDDLESLTLEDVNAFIRETLAPGKSWFVLVGPKR